MKKYQIIYADPPWSYSFSGTRAEETKDDYQTLKTEDICKFPIKELADNSCVLFIWGIWTKLPDILKVIKMWGFEYKTIGFVWLKGKKAFNPNQRSFLPQDSLEDFYGMGMWTRANTEFCLIGTKGNIQPISHSIKQLIYSPLREHSRKPDEIISKIVELMGDLPRIELFAREKTEGWDVWGNEVKSDIEL